MCMTILWLTMSSLSLALSTLTAHILQKNMTLIGSWKLPLSYGILIEATWIRRTRPDWPFLHSCCVENTPFPSKSIACIWRIFVIWFFRSIQLLECKLNKFNVFERFLIRWIFQILTCKLVIPFYWSPPQSGVRFSQIKISVNIWLRIISKTSISSEKTRETAHKFSEWNMLI